MEEWKFWKETNSWKVGHRIYEVSNEGNVRINGVLVDLSKLKTGRYYIIAGALVHRIVAKLFVPNPKNYPCIDHINCNKHDNRAENLRWCTPKQNSNNPITKKRNSEGHKGQIPWNKGLKMK